MLAGHGVGRLGCRPGAVSGRGGVRLCQNGAVTMAGEQPSAPSSPPRSYRAWYVGVAVVWGVILLAGIVWAAVRGEATVREQTTVADAQPTADRAAADIAAAATENGGAVVLLSGFERVEKCRITVFRSGARYERTVTALVAPGQEQALLLQVADRLPPHYRARTSTGNVIRLTADAGFYVSVKGSATASGEVRFVVDTGRCRPAGDPPPEPALATANRPTGPLADAGDAVLGTLGASAQRWSVFEVPCDAGALTTVEAIANVSGVDLAARQEELAETLDDAVRASRNGSSGDDQGMVIAATEHTFAYRSEAAKLGIAVRAVDGELIVTATTACH